MAKSRRTISTVLPTYQQDRQQWRKKILVKVREAAQAAGVHYDPNDRLEVVILLYLSEGKQLAIHDVDNRLKDILDALQGRFGASRSESRLIANDKQICRVLIEKQRIPKLMGNDSSWAGGRLLVRPYKRCRWPLQVTKANPLVKFRQT